jgi:hypothetical protein
VVLVTVVDEEPERLARSGLVQQERCVESPRSEALGEDSGAAAQLGWTPCSSRAMNRFRRV